MIKSDVSILSEYIPGFQRYSIHEDGGVFDTKLNKWLSPQITSDGYPAITLRSDDGIRKTFKIHRLVASAFISNIYNKSEVNHKDGNKLNNCHANLEWVTHSENIKHAWNNGLIKSTLERSAKLSKSHLGKRVGRDNLKSKPVRLINTGEIFESGCLAAKKYNLDQGRISRCGTGEEAA